MQAALELLLERPAYHAYTLMRNPDQAPFWSAAFEAKYHKNGFLYQREDWDRLLQHYGAVTDVPAICFAEDLIFAYPESKVVLVERDIDSWYSSFDKGVIASVAHPFNFILQRIDPQVMGRVLTANNYIFFDKLGFFRASNKEELRKNAKTIYREHYEQVRRVTPKERLLEFDLKTGWAPLCEFLGKPVPSSPFPRLNEGAAVNKETQALQERSFRNGLKNLQLVCMSVLAVLVAFICVWHGTAH